MVWPFSSSKAPETKSETSTTPKNTPRNALVRTDQRNLLKTSAWWLFANGASGAAGAVAQSASGRLLHYAADWLAFGIGIMASTATKVVTSTVALVGTAAVSAATRSSAPPSESVSKLTPGG
ncbi:MAG: hypothetical protein A3E84_03540 [Gammaproteobacteria bacterium RIFCSPHIGHO2_12_FULL_42_13]|nr:MAG: hypothetical protein A3E84_03540 [Gammaproteobacteria bacterium RIFCSPHIGHO2_12_FULL_42_13]